MKQLIWYSCASLTKDEHVLCIWSTETKHMHQREKLYLCKKKQTISPLWIPHFFFKMTRTSRRNQFDLTNVSDDHSRSLCGWSWCFKQRILMSGHEMLNQLCQPLDQLAWISLFNLQNYLKNGPFAQLHFLPVPTYQEHNKFLHSVNVSGPQQQM